jgi:polysaccharide deacetylase 2 family uncharacterized protein YibQ
LRFAKTILILLCTLWPLFVVAGDAPAISIIIDDLGNSALEGQRAVELPGPVACSFLPLAPHTPRLARLAWEQDKEVMVHLPMQSESQARVGPAGLTLDMSQDEFFQTLDMALAAVPHISGVNNHMGSLLTRQQRQMSWLMQVLQRRGDLFFVDSRTTPATVALRVAQQNYIPSLRRDVFLDDDPDALAVAEAFDRLIAQARETGHAVAIGHPYGPTLELLEKRLAALQSEGVVLIPLSEMIERREPSTWAGSLSHLPRVSRSSKR